MTITISPNVDDKNAINEALVRICQIFSGEVADNGTLLINYLRGGIKLSDGLKERIACDFLGCSTEGLAELKTAAVELQQSEEKRAETTPDELEKALLSLELGTAWSSAAELDEDVKTIRAHIAAQSSEIERIRVALEWIAYTECLVYECQEKARAALAQGAKK